MTAQNGEHLLSVGKVSKKLGVSISTLRRWDALGKLTSLHTPGNQRRYHLAQIETFLRGGKGDQGNKKFPPAFSSQHQPSVTQYLSNSVTHLSPHHLLYAAIAAIVTVQLLHLAILRVPQVKASMKAATSAIVGLRLRTQDKQDVSRKTQEENLPVLSNTHPVNPERSRRAPSRVLLSAFARAFFKSALYSGTHYFGSFSQGLSRTTESGTHYLAVTSPRKALAFALEVRSQVLIGRAILFPKPESTTTLTQANSIPKVLGTQNDPIPPQTPEETTASPSLFQSLFNWVWRLFSPAEPPLSPAPPTNTLTPQEQPLPEAEPGSSEVVLDSSDGDQLSVSAATLAGTGLLADSSKLNVEVGTTAKKIVQLDENGLYPAASGKKITDMDAANLKYGIIGTDRLDGQYGKIQGVGTLTEGYWNANIIADAYINNDLTLGTVSGNPTFSGNVTVTGTTTFSGGTSQTTTGQISLVSSQGAANAIELVASAGGIDISTGSGTADIDILSGDAITLKSVGGAISLSAGTQTHASGLLVNTSGDVVAGNNALYVDVSSGNIGIGTSTPGYKLEIDSGDIFIDSTRGIYFEDTNKSIFYRNGTLGASMGMVHGLDFALYSSSDDGFRFRGNGTIFEMNAGTRAAYFAGNLGIGDTSPDDKLDIEDANLGYNFLFGSSGITLSTSGTSGINTDTFGQLSLTSNQGAANALELISTAGGIDISAGSGTGDIDILSGDAINLKAINGSVTLSSGSPTHASGLLVNTSGDVTIGTNTLFADVSSGNVGIGTTSPRGGLLDVNGNIFFGTDTPTNSDYYIYGPNATDGGYGRPSIGIQATNGGNTLAFNNVNTVSFSNATQGTANVSMTGNLTVSGTGNSSIAGNLGIGDTSPDDKLDIESSSLGYNFLFGSGGVTLSTSGTSGINVDSFGQLSFTSSQGAANALELVSTAGGIDISTGSGTADIDILSGDAINLTLPALGSAITLSTGYNAGAGPDIVLQAGDAVNLKAINGSVTLSGGTPSHASGLLVNSSGDVIAGNNTLVVDVSAGNVGIGTTAPAGKLQVLTGTSSDEVFFGSFNPSAGGNGTQFSFNPAGYQGTGTLTLGYKENDDGQNNLLYFTLPYNGGGPIQLQARNVAGTVRNLSLQPSGGNVGIGTTTPGGLFEVEQTSLGGSFILGTSTGGLTLSGAGTAAFTMASGGAISLSAGTGQSSAGGITVATTGNVGIAQATPAHKLDVVGTAGLSTGTAWTNTSDFRYKDVQADLTGSSLDKVLALRPISYTWNALHDNKYGADPGLNYGFIAQEVGAVIPELVTQDKDGFYLYNPSGFEAVLTAAIQEQQEKIDLIFDHFGDAIDQGESALDALVAQIPDPEETSQSPSILTELTNLTQRLLGVESQVTQLDTNLQSLQDRVSSLQDPVLSDSGLQSLETRLALIEEALSLGDTATYSAILGTRTQEEQEIDGITQEKEASSTATPAFSSDNPASSGVLRLDEDLAIDANLLVTGETMVTTLSASDMVTVGTLVLNPQDSSLESLLNTLKIQPTALQAISFEGGSIEFTTSGDVKINQGRLALNDRVRGRIALEAGQKEVTLNLTERGLTPWEDAPQVIQVTPSYLTQIAVTKLESDGFTVTLSETPTVPQTLYWLALW